MPQKKSFSMVGVLCYFLVVGYIVVGHEIPMEWIY